MPYPERRVGDRQVATTEPSAPAANGARPTDGDIVVREGAGVKCHYVVGVFPGPAQVGYRWRAEALAQARTFGQQQQVDCWLTHDGKTFMLLGRHRSLS